MSDFCPQCEQLVDMASHSCRFPKRKHTCRLCGKEVHGFAILRRMCEDCGRAECKKGNHVWEPAAIGPGVAIFDCLYCDATSDGSLKPLEQMGFVEVKGK